MHNINALSVLIFIVILGLGGGGAYMSFAAGDFGDAATIAAIFPILAFLVAYSIKIVDQWQRIVVLRLGRFHGLKGPGLFLIIPFIDQIAYRIDIRVIASAFKAEKTLTKDTVPVDVDAVLFWKVVDPQ